MTTRYATHTFHSLSYYKRLLLCIAKCLTDGATDKAIVAELIREDIRTPVGATFNVAALKHILKSLRNPAAYSSLVHRALLQLHFDGEMTKSQCLPLLTVRPGTMS